MRFGVLLFGVFLVRGFGYGCKRFGFSWFGFRGFADRGFELRVTGTRLRVRCSGFSGFRIWDSVFWRFRVSRITVSISGFRGSRCRVSSIGVAVSWFRVAGCGLGVRGFGGLEFWV